MRLVCRGRCIGPLRLNPVEEPAVRRLSGPSPGETRLCCLPPRQWPSPGSPRIAPRGPTIPRPAGRVQPQRWERCAAPVAVFPGPVRPGRRCSSARARVLPALCSSTPGGKCARAGAAGVLRGAYCRPHGAKVRLFFLIELGKEIRWGRSWAVAALFPPDPPLAWRAVPGQSGRERVGTVRA